MILGLSWFVGIGSVDIDFNIPISGSQFSGMGGYTNRSPKMIKR